jgi:hypothetical protein
MNSILVQIIFGWPAILATLLIALAGLIWKRWWLLLVSAILFTPFSWYLSGYPAVRGVAILLPFFLLGSAIATRARKHGLTRLLATPPFIVSAWLALLVVRQ